MTLRMSTREGFGQGLLAVGRERSDVVVVAADTGKSMKTNYFAAEFPDRVFDTGIAEQDMVLVAAGLATTGKVAFATTYATLATLRACEQIRSFVAYPRLNVKVVAGMSGLTGDLEGVTHQGIEDVGVMRSIPNMTVVCPADGIAAKKAVKAIADHPGPVYMRVGRNDTPVVYTEEMEFRLGEVVVHRDGGDDVAILASGLALPIALEAEKLLAEEGVKAKVAEVHTLKPINTEAVVELARATGAIVTVEDHNVIGGLGSAVAEVLGEHYPCRLKRVGIPDCFTESAPYEELLEAYGISAAAVSRAAKEVAQEKRR
ncbi:MAG: transketolase C-terminal domain-containing protein [Bacillota bacterium]|nr:transketolase C-terminal domain-containing protein [Bacillota bacterium]